MNNLNHIALIMDGNGRWAKQQGLPRVQGHKRGLDVAQRVIDHCISLNVKYVSLYVFSTENWKRPKSEVDSLFSLSLAYISKFEKFCKDKVRVVVSGRRDGLPSNLVREIDAIEKSTSSFDTICVNLCINYGGQTEIVDAVNKLVANNLPITEQNILQNLYNRLPCPDLIVRTGGHKRISNFLLYQSAYAEYAFTDTLWPNFTNAELDKIVEDFYLRTRNFGGLTNA